MQLKFNDKRYQMASLIKGKFDPAVDLDTISATDMEEKGGGFQTHQVRRRKMLNCLKNSGKPPNCSFSSEGRQVLSQRR